MKRADFRCMERLRVRRDEIDARKIVFDAHYLVYFETAVSGYWRALALPRAQTMEYLSGDLLMRRATIECEGWARHDDVLDIGVRCTRAGTSSLLFSAAVFRQDELLVSGELQYVFADPSSPTSQPVPQELREALHAFEAGKPMVDVRVGGWDELGRDARAVRTAVFVQEQKIPPEMEWDEADAGCVHAVAYNRLGVPLATGRLLEHVPGVAKIGRMAVMRPLRGSRVGRSVLDALMNAARSRGEREVVLHAQMSAVPFYVRAGFNERGTVFEEAGIPHVEMVRGL